MYCVCIWKYLENNSKNLETKILSVNLVTSGNQGLHSVQGVLEVKRHFTLLQAKSMLGLNFFILPTTVFFSILTVVA